MKYDQANARTAFCANNLAVVGHIVLAANPDQFIDELLRIATTRCALHAVFLRVLSITEQDRLYHYGSFWIAIHLCSPSWRRAGTASESLSDLAFFLTSLNTYVFCADECFTGLPGSPLYPTADECAAFF